MISPLAVAGLVLLAAVMHAAWNAVVKSDADRTAAMLAVLSVGLGIGSVLALIAPLPDRAAWPWLLSSSATHAVYYVCLLRAYGSGDLSRVYPIARGTAPALVALVVAPLAGEPVSLVDVIGAGMVSLGIGSLALGEPAAADEA